MRNQRTKDNQRALIVKKVAEKNGGYTGICLHGNRRNKE